MIEIVAKRTLTRQQEGYLYIDWVSPVRPITRLQTTYIWPKGQKTERGYLDAR